MRMSLRWFIQGGREPRVWAQTRASVRVRVRGRAWRACHAPGQRPPAPWVPGPAQHSPGAGREAEAPT